MSKRDAGRMMEAWLVREILEPMADCFYNLMHPLQTLEQWLEDLLRPPVERVSKGEAKLLSLVERIYGPGEVEPQYVPDWLTGPGGAQMHLDVAVPRHRIAFEYQGQQHDRPIAHWGGSQKLHRQQQRDAYKKDLLQRRGWRLIEWWYDEPMSLPRLQRKIASMD